MSNVVRCNSTGWWRLRRQAGDRRPATEISSSHGTQPLCTGIVWPEHGASHPTSSRSCSVRGAFEWHIGQAGSQAGNDCWSDRSATPRWFGLARRQCGVFESCVSKTNNDGSWVQHPNPKEPPSTRRSRPCSRTSLQLTSKRHRAPHLGHLSYLGRQLLHPLQRTGLSGHAKGECTSAVLGVGIRRLRLATAKRAGLGVPGTRWVVRAERGRG